MKTALIPPIPHLQEATGRQFHLILAHLAETSLKYRFFYCEEAALGSYIILDNSAHENTFGQPIENLLKLAPEVGAREIVIPDKLFNWYETISSAERSFSYLHEYMRDVLSPYRWMIVPQGDDVHEWKVCLDGLLGVINATYENSPNLLAKGFTLGLSKDFEIWKGGLYGLIQDYLLPVKEKYNCDVHLLGWGRNLWALQTIAKDFGDQIRSIDSAKPYVYGLHGIKVDENFPQCPPYPKRDPDYFQSSLTDIQLECARHNVQVFDDISLQVTRV